MRPMQRWWKRIKGIGSRKTRRGQARKRPSAMLLLEALEQRTTPTGPAPLDPDEIQRLRDAINRGEVLS